MTARIELLFNKFIDGTCSQDEFSELMDLIRKNGQEEKVRPILYRVYQHASRNRKSITYVDEHGQLQTVMEDAPAAIPDNKVGRRPQPLYRRIATIIAVAALLAAAGSLFLDRYRTAGPSMAMPLTRIGHQVTLRGESRHVVLPDGTQVWLNAASSLDYPTHFTTGKREVYLQGEAWFEVSQAGSTPFLVHTGKRVTQTQAGSYNIDAYYGQQEIRVSVKAGNAVLLKNSRQLASMARGQQAVMSYLTGETMVTPIPVNTIGQWTHGILQYDHRPVLDIIQDLERSYDVIVIIKDETLQAVTLTTSLRKDMGVQHALELICKAIGRRLTVEKETYTIDNR